jgi:glycine cleavage system H lipoate-binding protein
MWKQEGNRLTLEDNFLKSIGDITYFEVHTGAYKKGDVIGLVESAKTAVDLEMPFDGEIVKVEGYEVWIK